MEEVSDLVHLKSDVIQALEKMKATTSDLEITSGRRGTGGKVGRGSPFSGAFLKNATYLMLGAMGLLGIGFFLMVDEATQARVFKEAEAFFGFLTSLFSSLF